MAVQMSRQAEARKQNKDLIRGSTTSETATDSTRVDLVEPHKKDLKSAIKPEDGVQPKSELKSMWCGGQQHKRQSCLAKDVTCTVVTKEDIFKLFVSPRNRRRNAGPSTKWQILKKSKFLSSVKSTAAKQTSGPPL